MKSFTIGMPSAAIDSKGIYKNFLLKRLLQSYPELVIDGIDTEETPYSYQYIGPNDKIMFGPYRYSRCDVSKFKGLRYWFAPKNYDMATEFELAMKKLDDYYKEMMEGEKRYYDFKLPDGTPVKEYQNFIQIGYNMIPKKGYRNYFSNLSNKSKTVINNAITIIINNY